MPHKYTDKQKEFIRKNAIGKSTKELTNMINEKFDINLKSNQIRAYKKNHKIVSGLDSKFSKGHTPWTKGKKRTWHSLTEFKKNSVPHNYLPVGTERVNGNGYIDIKIADPKTWKAKHIIIWEEKNGKVPEGYKLAFADQDKSNVSLENIILVSKQQQLIMNKKGLFFKDAEITRTGAIIAKVHQSIYERSK